MNLPRSKMVCILGLVLVLGQVQVAQAQSDQERAGAREAARDGIEAYHEGKYEEALRLLVRAQSLVNAPTHLLFIARSRVKLGMLVEAREAYQQIITSNLPPDASKAFLNAQEVAPAELAEIEKRIASLTVEVTGPGGAEVTGLVVKINGAPLSLALVGISVPVNPGKSEIVVVADGMKTQTKTVILGESGSGSVQFELEPGTSTGPSAEKVDDASEQDEATSSTMSPKRKAGFVVAGVGAATTIFGGVFGILSTSQLSRAREDEALCGEEKLCTEDGRKEVDAAQTKALIADISMGVGLVAVGVGTYLIVTGKPKDNTVGVRAVIPAADQYGGYLLVRGGF